MNEKETVAVFENKNRQGNGSIILSRGRGSSLVQPTGIIFVAQR